MAARRCFRYREYRQMGDEGVTQFAAVIDTMQMKEKKTRGSERKRHHTAFYFFLLAFSADFVTKEQKKQSASYLRIYAGSN